MIDLKKLREIASDTETDNGHEFMEAFSPKTILSLLDRLEAAEARVKELEKELEEAYETIIKHCGVGP